MKYTIYSIDDTRAEYKKNIRGACQRWEEVDVGCVDGRNAVELEAALSHHGYEVHYEKWEHPAKVGQLGIWCSFLNALEHAPIVTFDDDAMLMNMFAIHFKIRLKELPDDADFFSNFIPRDSDHLWNDSLSVSPLLTKVYQRYGGVSFYFTERGKYNIKRLLERDGITAQYDDTLYAYAKSGELNGYCSKPEYADLVYITGEEISLVQETAHAR